MVQEECENRLTSLEGLGNLRQLAKEIGRIAQLGERCPYKAEVTGSIPVPPTILSSGTEKQDKEYTDPYSKLGT